MMNRKPSDRPVNASSLLKQLHTIEKVVKRSVPPATVEKKLNLFPGAIPWKVVSFVGGIACVGLGWYGGGWIGAAVGGAVGLILMAITARFTTFKIIPKQSFPAHAKTTTALAVTPDGLFLISAGAIAQSRSGNARIVNSPTLCLVIAIGSIVWRLPWWTDAL